MTKQRSAVIMNTIIDSQWNILLSVQGTNIWSGQQPQQYNSQAIAWGLRYVFIFNLPPSNLLMIFVTVMNCLPLANDTNSSLGRIWLVSWCRYRFGSCTNFGLNWEPITFTPPSFGTSNICLLSWRITILMYLHRSFCIGVLSVGINSSVMPLFVVGFASQWWMRTRYPHWFAKYNYILAAGLDGGTQVRSISIHFILISFTKAMLGRSWSLFFRLLFKEHLGILICSRSGENALLHPFVIYTDVCCYFRWGANQEGWSDRYPVLANKYTNSNISRELW